MANKIRILILCTGNSCRSQMTEAFFEKYGSDDFEVVSAGLDPRPINVFAREVMIESDIDLSGKRSKSVREFLGRDRFDYVIFVCNKAEKSCPRLYAIPAHKSLSWPFPDPAEAEGDDFEKLKAFRLIRDCIEEKVKEWIEDFRKNRAENK